MSNEVITSRKKQGRLAGKDFVRKNCCVVVQDCIFTTLIKVNILLYLIELIKDPRKFEVNRGRNKLLDRQKYFIAFVKHDMT